MKADYHKYCTYSADVASICSSQMCFQPSTGEELPFSDQQHLSPSLSKISSKCLIYSIFFNNFSADFIVCDLELRVDCGEILSSASKTHSAVSALGKASYTEEQPTASLLQSCRCVSSHYDYQLELRSACLTTMLLFYMHWLLWKVNHNTTIPSCISKQSIPDHPPSHNLHHCGSRNDIGCQKQPPDWLHSPMMAADQGQVLGPPLLISTTDIPAAWLVCPHLPLDPNLFEAKTFCSVPDIMHFQPG